MKKSKTKFLLFLIIIFIFLGLVFFDNISKSNSVSFKNTNELNRFFREKHGFVFNVSDTLVLSHNQFIYQDNYTLTELETNLTDFYSIKFNAVDSRAGNKKIINKSQTIKNYTDTFSGKKSYNLNKAIYLGSFMFILWMLEIVPIFLTALLPIIAGPMLGLVNFDQLASCYGNHNIFLFFGGFILALALERWKVHDQITARLLHYLGDSLQNILLGFILSAALLSMWISNTATTLIMLPIALSVISRVPEIMKAKFSVLLLLGLAYAANIGGMATLVGSPPNIQMAGILEQQFGIEITFFDWISIGLPISIFLIIILFLFFKFKLGVHGQYKIQHIRNLEPWSSNQKKVLIVFLSVVFCWVFRDLIQSFFEIKFKDLLPVLIASFFLFVIPSHDIKGGSLLKWDDTKEIPWGILLLFGGGLALAKILELNGVIDMVIEFIMGISNYQLWTIILILVIISVFATEVISNLALVTLLIPVVGFFAKEAGLNIITLALPVALAASCAFMFPISTPPNAIVYSSGKISMNKMFRIGIILNIVSISVITFLSFILLS